jgi:hypothetical protein
VTVFVWFSIDDDRDTARASLRESVAVALEQDAIQAQLGHLAAAGPTEAVLAEITVSGRPTDCAAAIRALRAAEPTPSCCNPCPEPRSSSWRGFGTICSRCSVTD